MKKLIILLCLTYSHEVIAQKVSWEKIPFETISEISYRNDSIINKRVFPFLTENDNGLIYRVTSSSIPNDQNELYAKNIIEEYLEKNELKDNNHNKKRYAITFKDSIYSLNKYNTIRRYYYWPWTGIISCVAIDEKPGYLEDEIFCIFNDNIRYPRSTFSLYKIKPTSDKFYINPNYRITFQSGASNYIFYYHASLCKDRFQFEGLGTIGPTFFNITLEVKSEINGDSQVLLQIPHSELYKLSGIEIGDINSDGKDDIILTIEDMLCIKRLIYLFTKDSNRTYFKYLGNMEIYCDYP